MIKTATFITILVFTLVSCSVKIPQGVEPVKPFELERYLGKWYEIARLDHPFERGMSDVTAEYTLRDDGSVGVVNRGYLFKSKEWKEARGRARFVGDEEIGFLKVSFWGPFYASYVIFRLDQQNYNYALVSGPNKKYLWLLARDPKLSARTKEHLVSYARSRGFETDNLQFVAHSPKATAEDSAE